MRQKIIISFLFLIAMVMAVMVTVPTLKKSLKTFFVDQNRTILAKVQGPIASHSANYVILKIKQKEDIFVEVFREEEKTENLIFVQKIEIPENKEAHFNFKGEFTNLAFADVDGDGYLEILVPVFNNEMTARLHTYKFNEGTQMFELVSRP